MTKLTIVHTLIIPKLACTLAPTLRLAAINNEQTLSHSMRLRLDGTLFDFVLRILLTPYTPFIYYNIIQETIYLLKRSEMKTIAILIPCYNEANTIEKVIKGFQKYMPEASIYVYDNNSTDGTAKIAKKAGAIVRKERKQGKGNVIRRMFREIDADCYIMIDGDNTYPAKSARIMADEVLRRQADMVVGDRLSSTYYTENKRPFHNFGNSLVRLLINRLFHGDIKDIMTGYRAFSYDFVKSFPVLSNGFEIETEMTIHALDKDMLVRNVIVEYRDRPSGSVSKLNTFSDGAKVLFTIVRLCRIYRPFLFFGTISILLLVISIALFAPVFASFLQTGEVDRFPTLIACGFIALAAIQSFFSGLILQTILHKNRQDFELLRTELSFRKKMDNGK